MKIEPVAWQYEHNGYTSVTADKFLAGERATPLYAIPDTHVIVPREPTDELLKSMAIRYDHGLGIPGYYDENPITGEPNEINHDARLKTVLGIMRQLHEEVVGEGFYKAAGVDDG